MRVMRAAFHAELDELTGRTRSHRRVALPKTVSAV
jgi:hypothetical protein